MARLALIVFGTAFVAAGGILIFLLLGDVSYRFSLSPEELQLRAEERFPIEEETSIAALILSRPEMVLVEGADRLGLTMLLRVRLPSLQLGEEGLLNRVVTGRATVEAGLRYQPEQRAVFLGDPRLEELDVPGLAGEQVPAIKGLVERSLRSRFDGTPLHTLPDHLEGEAGGMFLKSVRVTGGQLVVELQSP